MINIWENYVLQTNFHLFLSCLLAIPLHAVNVTINALCVPEALYLIFFHLFVWLERNINTCIWICQVFLFISSNTLWSDFCESLTPGILLHQRVFIWFYLLLKSLSYKVLVFLHLVYLVLHSVCELLHLNSSITF